MDNSTVVCRRIIIINFLSVIYLHNFCDFCFNEKITIFDCYTWVHCFIVDAVCSKQAVDPQLHGCVNISALLELLLDSVKLDWENWVCMVILFGYRNDHWQTLMPLNCTGCIPS